MYPSAAAQVQYSMAGEKIDLLTEGKEGGLCVGGMLLLQSPAPLYPLLPFPENTHSLLGDPSLLNIWLVSSLLNPSPFLPLLTGLFAHYASFSYLTISP